MPSSTKVASSLCLCALAYILSELVKPTFIEDYNFGYFTYVSMLVGVIVGWTSMGERVGFGLIPAINNGIMGTFSMVASVIFIQSANEMIRLSMRGRCDTLSDALLGIVSYWDRFCCSGFFNGFVGHCIDWRNTGRIDCRSHLEPRALII